MSRICSLNLDGSWSREAKILLSMSVNAVVRLERAYNDPRRKTKPTLTVKRYINGSPGNDVSVANAYRAIMSIF